MVNSLETVEPAEPEEPEMRKSIRSPGQEEAEDVAADLPRQGKIRSLEESIEIEIIDD